MKIDKGEFRKTAVQLLKYGVIGVMNTVITLVTFYVLNTKAEVSYGISNVVGYILGVINSFIWNRKWVFKTHNNVRREALLFGGGFLLCLTLLGWKSLPDDVIPFMPMAKSGQNIVMVIAMVVYTLANYAYNRLVTFKEH